MILHTILNGRPIRGSVEKKIMHPYTGASPDAVSYARELAIAPFASVKDIRTFRSGLFSAAQSISRYLEKNGDTIARIAADETGSPIAYQHHDLAGARAFLRKLRILEGLLPATYRFEPKGNVLLILSANEPIVTSTILVFSCLFTGNTVFVKPSSKSPSFSRMLIKELVKIPALKRRVHYLLIDGEETERLIRSRAFDVVLSFGSRATNKKLGVVCAESEAEFLPESEGNDWAYVDKGYPAMKAMSAMVADSFVRHNGQMCNALRGVMIHASLYEELLAQLKNHLSALAVGDPRRGQTRAGALIAGTHARAQEIAHEAQAQAKGAWSAPSHGAGFAPTIIAEPDEASSIYRESIFAPVLWVKKVKNCGEAISFFKKMNRHGLGFSVFSKDKKAVEECIKHIRVGRLNINKPPLGIGLFDPLGGIGLSGRGGPSQWVEKVSNRVYLNK